MFPYQMLFGMMIDRPDLEKVSRAVAKVLRVLD
jgi:hypothetical protein